MGKITRYFDKHNTTDSTSKKHNKGSIKSNVKFKRKKKINDRKQYQGKEQTNKKQDKIPKTLLRKYSRGPGLSKKGIKTILHQKKFEKKEQNIRFATEIAADTEILLTEESGYLEAGDGETTTQFTQKDIVKNVDITAATKHFDIHLKEFGPYRAKYTRNGRHLLLGGRKGHVAAFDWVTKRLHCELNVMESVHDICWLHIETMYAVAQKSWLYVYDNQGIELHCLKKIHKVFQMEFLPYHFLLNSISESGILTWLDISIGEIIAQFNTRLGKPSVMTQNPYNAVTCVAHPRGIVTMWAPKTKDPLAKMLCHKGPITALHVDPKGLYMATAGLDKHMKIWDIRKLHGPLQIYKVSSAANNLAFSQKNLLAVGMGNVLEVYKNCCVESVNRPYLRHCFNNTIRNFQFCPFEDVLGVATDWGFTSLLVPGAGEANFDALEANPYQTKSQRREFEVKALLEKVQPELINLNPTVISEVDIPTLKDKVEAKKKLLFLKPPKINYEPRNKAKGKGGSVKISKNKKIVQEEAKRVFVKTIKSAGKQEENKIANKKRKKALLDRFLRNK